MRLRFFEVEVAQTLVFYETVRVLFFLLLCTVYVLILHASFLPQSPCAKSVKNGFGNRSVKVQLQDSRVDAETSMNSDMFFLFFGDHILLVLAAFNTKASQLATLSVAQEKKSLLPRLFCRVSDSIVELTLQE